MQCRHCGDVNSTHTDLDAVACYTPELLGYRPAQHVTVLNTIDNCSTMLGIGVSKYRKGAVTILSKG